MNYLKEYASNIVIISVLSTIFEIIIPDGKNKKVASVVIGLVVMLTIISPLERISEIKGSFLFPTFETENVSTGYEKNMVADAFEENLSYAMEEKIKEKLQKDISFTVVTSRNDVGEITKIESIRLSPYDDEAAKLAAAEFSLEPNIIIEGDKND